jgi:hypothetical protein
MNTFIIILILLSGFLLNIYKIKLAQSSPYFMYVCSESPQLVKTKPLYLQLHIVTSLILLLIAFARCLWPTSILIEILFPIYHIIFILIIIPNIHHYGEYPWFIALLINGGLITMLQYAYMYTSSLSYFVVLSLPILLEILYIITSLLDQLIWLINFLY